MLYMLVEQKENNDTLFFLNKGNPGTITALLFQFNFIFIELKFYLIIIVHITLQKKSNVTDKRKWFSLGLLFFLNFQYLNVFTYKDCHYFTF